MRFDSREWVNEIIAGTVTGAAAGAVAATFVPDPPFGVAISAGAMAGLVTGLLNLPVKWLAGRRPGVKGDDDEQP